MNESERRSSKYSSLSILYALMVLLLISSNRGLISSDRGAGGYFLSKSSSKRISACLSGIFCLKAFPFSLSVAVFLFGVRRTLHHKYDSYFTTFVISWCHYLLSAHRWAVAVLSFPQSVQYFVSVKQAC